MAKVTIPREVKATFKQDARIVTVTHYLDGWVPNAYGWPKPGRSNRYRRNEDGSIEHVASGRYDRKRSHGRGPELVGFSAKGGRLASK